MAAGQQLNTYETSNTLPNFFYENSGASVCQQDGCCNLIAQYIPNRDNGDIWFVNPLGELFVLPDGYAHTIYIETIPSLINWKLTQFTLKNINCYAGTNDEIIRPPYYQSFIGFQTDISHAVVFYKKPLKKITKDAYVKIYDGLFMHVADFLYSAESMSCGTRSEWNQYRDCGMRECTIEGKEDDPDTEEREDKEVLEDIWAYRKSMQCIRTPGEVSLGAYTCNRAFQDNDVRNNVVAGVENCKKAVRECYDIKAEANNPVKPRTPPCDFCGDPHINTGGGTAERIYGKAADYNCNEGMEEQMYGLRVICEGFPGVNDGISYTYPGAGTFDNGYFATGYQNDYLALCAYAYRAHTSAVTQYDIRGTLESANDLPLYKYTTDEEGYVLDEEGEQVLDDDDDDKPMTKEDLCKKDKQIEMDAAPDDRHDTIKTSRCVFEGDAFVISSELWVYVGDRWVNKGLHFGYEFWKIFYQDNSASPEQKGDEQCRPLYKPLWQGRIGGVGNIIECGNHVWVDSYDKALIHDGKVAYDIKYEDYYKWEHLEDTNNRLFCQNQVAYIRIRVSEDKYRTIMYAQFAEDKEFTKIFDTTQTLEQSLDLRGMHQDYLLFKHIDEDDLILYCRTQKIYEDDEFMFLGTVGTTSYPAPHYYAIVGTLVGDEVGTRLDGKVWKDCSETTGKLYRCPYVGDDWDAGEGWCIFDEELIEDIISTQRCRYPNGSVGSITCYPPVYNDGMGINSLGSQFNGGNQEGFAASQWNCTCHDKSRTDSVTLVKAVGSDAGCDVLEAGVTYHVWQSLATGFPTYQMKSSGYRYLSKVKVGSSHAQGAALLCDTWTPTNKGLDCDTGYSVFAEMYQLSALDALIAEINVTICLSPGPTSELSNLLKPENRDILIASTKNLTGWVPSISSTIQRYSYKKGNEIKGIAYVDVVPFDWFRTLTITNCEIPGSTQIASFSRCGACPTQVENKTCGNSVISGYVVGSHNGPHNFYAYGSSTVRCAETIISGSIEQMSPPYVRPVIDASSPISNDTHSTVVIFPNYRFSVHIELQHKTFSFTYASAFTDCERVCALNPHYDPSSNVAVKGACANYPCDCGGWYGIIAPYSCSTNIQEINPSQWGISQPTYQTISTEWGEKRYLALLIPEKLYNFSTLIGSPIEGQYHTVYACDDGFYEGNDVSIDYTNPHITGRNVQGYLLYEIHVIEITDTSASEVLTISNLIEPDTTQFRFVGTYNSDPGLWISWKEYKAAGEYLCGCIIVDQPCQVAFIAGDPSPKPDYTDINGVHHCAFGGKHCGIAVVHTAGTTARLTPVNKNYSVKGEPGLICCGWYYGIHYLPPGDNTQLTGEIFWLNYSLHSGTTYSLSCCNEWFSTITYNGTTHYFAGKTDVYSHPENGDSQYDSVSWICCGHFGVLRMLKNKEGQFDHCGNPFVRQFQVLNSDVEMVMDMLKNNQYSSIASSLSPIPELQPGQKFEEIGTYIDVYTDKVNGQYFGIINDKKDICKQPVPAGYDYTQSHGKVYMVNDTGVAKELYDDPRIDNIECCNPPHYDEKGDYVKPHLIWATFLLDPNIYKHVEMFVEEEKGGEGSSIKETGTQELTYPNPYPRLPDEYKRPQQMTMEQFYHRFPGRGVYIWNQGGDRLSTHHGKNDTVPCWFDDTGSESHRGKFLFWGDMFATPRYDFQWTHTYGTEPRWKGSVPFTCANNRLIFNANGVYHVFDLDYGRLDLSTVTLKIPTSKQD